MVGASVFGLEFGVGGSFVLGFVLGYSLLGLKLALG